MDHRPVVKAKSDYYWRCPECGEKNEEHVVPGAPDLTCQACGANYKNGTPLPPSTRKWVQCFNVAAVHGPAGINGKMEELDISTGDIISIESIGGQFSTNSYRVWYKTK